MVFRLPVNWMFPLLRIGVLTFCTVVVLTAGVYVDDAAACCAGDCNGDGLVTIDEALLLVNAALGNVPPTASCKCPPFCEIVLIQCIDAAVGNIFLDCTGRSGRPQPQDR